MATQGNIDDDCVLIAGAGPVGLVAALCLAEAGIPVRVFEMEPDLVEDLRASTFHPPTLDMLDRFGITAELLAQGLICPDWQTRLHPSGERAVFDLSVLKDDTKHPYRLQCEQWRLSRAALARLQRLGNAEVNFGTALVDLAQDDRGVTVTLDRAGNRSTARGRYLIGADGSRSAVRKAIGVEFDGETYPETTILATTTFPFQDHLPGLSNVSYCWKEGGGNFSLLRLPGFWRVSVYPPEDRPIEEALTPEAMQAALQAIVPNSDGYEITQWRPYRVHQRIASTYRKGRVLLCGDAAHLNSPAGGMGMNGGVHDAFNLTEKLARVWKGESDALLDLYERQRKPVAKNEIIAQADRNRARMREKDPAKRRATLGDLQAITRDRQKLYDYVLRSSMIAGLRQAAAVS